MGAEDVVGLVMRLAFAAGDAIAQAIARGDVAAVELLTQHLDGPEILRARDAALQAAQRRRAEHELGSST
jgi:hypothetical protein